MKLYFFPSACSAAVHIILEEIKAKFELIYVGKNAAIEALKDFNCINPLKSVPALELDSGLILTQNIAILEYLADTNPEYNLLAPIGSFDRVEIIKWSSFIATDIHKSFSPLFLLDRISPSKTTQSEVIQWSISNINKYFSLLNNHLEHENYLACEKFTIADAYLFVVFQWTKYTNIKTAGFPFLNEYIKNLATRQSIQNVMNKEKQYK